MESFVHAFERLAGNLPFPWQSALFEKFLSGEFPVTCSLPTGLGKTSIMAVWLIALAHRPHNIPRRLAYAVNHRTVMDQATNEAIRLRNNLSECPGVSEALRRLAAQGSEIPLAISTLRGQFADNAEWRDDPAQPAIVVGTIDMIGSRLLFSGYRCGFKSKPNHAGLLGQDTLLIHDEAHLEPAFQQLLLTIEEEQRHGRYPDFRPFRVIELSAITRGSSKSNDSTESQDTFGLQPADYENLTVQKRIHAKKGLRKDAVT